MQKTDLAFFGFRGGKGGISNVMLNLMNSSALFLKGIDVLVNNPNIPELDLLNPKINIINLNESPGLISLPSLLDYINKKRPKVILTNRERANRVLALATPFINYPIKIVFRVGMPISTALERRNLVKRAFRKYSIKYAYKRAEIVIANSNKVAEDILDITGISTDRIKVLNNPTVSDKLYELSNAPTPHKWLDEDMPVIMGIGRLARQKGFETLIKAFYKVVQRTEARLIILGEGKERDSLLNLIRYLGITDKVALPGFTSNPFAFLSRASCFVLSSAWEGSPNVLIEALALGIPVVATDCPTGPREILKNGRYGELVEVHNHNQMAEAILKVLSSPPPPSFLKYAAEPYRAIPATITYLKVMGLLSD